MNWHPHALAILISVSALAAIILPTALESYSQRNSRTRAWVMALLTWAVPAALVTVAFIFI